MVQQRQGGTASSPPDSGGEDLFVHHTEIAGSGFKTLAEGAKIEFEVTQGQKGPQATDVQVIAQ